MQKLIRVFNECKASDCLGERNSNSVLTEKEVLEIRKLYVPYEISYRDIAERYEV